MRMRHRTFRSARAALAVTLTLLLASCSQESEPLAPQPDAGFRAGVSATGGNEGRLVALVANAGGDNVSVVDIAARRQLTTMKVGDSPREVAITPDGSLALVTNSLDDDVSVIDLAARQEVATVEVGKFPIGVAITPDGTLALVTNAGDEDVSVIDIAGRSEVGRVNVVGQPADVAITPDGTTALVVNRRSPDGASCGIVFSNPCFVSVIDIGARREVDRIPTGGTGPIGVAITPDGSLALVANTESVPDNVGVLDIAGRSVVGRVNVGRIPWSVAITPDGALALVTNNGSSGDVSVIDIGSRSEVARVDVGGGPRGVEITPDGELALVTNDRDGTVSLIDLSSLSETTAVAVGDLPGGVAITRLLELEIDIKPGDEENTVSLEGRGMISVAILSTQTAAADALNFDASSADATTVRFGPDQASPVHDLSDPQTLDLHLLDVDGDGDEDLNLHFSTEETGIQSSDREATLSGQTLQGAGFAGRDHLRTVTRPEPPEPPLLPGPLTSLELHLNHADCGPLRGGSPGSWNFFLNGESLGSAGTVSPCQCNAEEQEVTFTDREALRAWKPSGGNTISVEAVGTTPINDIAIGYIRAELEARQGSATVAVFDATGDDASNRDICEGFVWEEDQSVFSATIE